MQGTCTILASMACPDIVAVGKV